MPPIGDDLRREMKRLRLHPVKWGNPRGLTQQELADMTGTAAISVRQLERGYKGASVNTVGLLCYTLGVPVGWLRARGYDDIADIVAEWSKAGVTSPDTVPDEPVSAAEEDYLRNAPDFTEQEAEQLIETLRAMRREEPLGKKLWRRRRSA